MALLDTSIVSYIITFEANVEVSKNVDISVTIRGALIVTLAGV